MIRGLYTASTGMNAQQHQIDVTSNNIANVNTTAFKKDRAEFQDLMYEALNYTGGTTSEITTNPTGIDVGLGTRVAGIQKNFLQGNMKETGNPLDIAIEGKGFFSVVLPNGETAYTRNGSFKVDAEGGIVNGQGYRVQPEIIIPNNVVNVSIGDDGMIAGTDAGTGQIVNLGQLTLTDFVNPAGLSPHGNSMYLASDTSGDPIEGNPGLDGLGNLRQGMLESSNVKLVSEMVDLITAQRAYEANSKSISTTDEVLDIVNRLKR
jgi:flagellar basal-body rod protein FlgG